MCTRLQRHRPLLAILLLAALGPGCSAGSVAGPPEPPDPALAPVYSYVDAVGDGSTERTFVVLRPTAVAPEERLPVVVALHGINVSATEFMADDDWRTAVERRRFVAVFPQGAFESWNAGGCCVSTADDVGFLLDVLGRVRSTVPVDDMRIHLTGFSNGAMMAYRMACLTSGVFASIAPVGGANPSGCSPAAPVPTLHVHGVDDEVITFDGHQAGWWPTDLPPVPDAVGAWATAMGCGPATVTEEDTWTAHRWDCPPPTRVELLALDGQRHDWPRPPVLETLSTVLDFFGIAPAAPGGDDDAPGAPA